MTRTLSPSTDVCRALALACALLASASWAVQRGEALIISLNNGKTVTGTLLSETGTGFLVKTGSGTQMVPFGDIADMQTPGAPPPAPPVQPAPYQPAPYQPAPYQPAPQRSRVRQEQPSAGSFASRVSFFARSERDNYDVVLGDQSCQTPCMLELRPGPARLAASGSGRVAASLNVPSGESYVQLQHQSGVVLAGWVLMSSGLGLGLGGLSWLALGSVGVAFTIIFAVTGGVMAIVGTVMLIAGQKMRAQLRPGRAPFASAPVKPIDQPLVQWAWGH